MTEVLPLQKQSKLGWALSSLSMALYDLRKASVHKYVTFSSVVASLSGLCPSDLIFPVQQVVPEPLLFDSQ